MQRPFCPVHGHAVPNFSPSISRLNISDSQPHTPSPMTLSPSPAASPRASPHSSPSADRLDVSGSPLAFSKWARKTVAELKEILADKGLPISGNKTILIDRLETWEKNPNDPRLREKRKIAESKPKEPAVKRSSPVPSKPLEEGTLVVPHLHAEIVRLVCGKYEQIIEATKSSFKGYALSLHDNGQFDLLKQLTVTRPDGTRSVGEDYRGNWYLAWRKGVQPIEGHAEDSAEQILHATVLILQAATRNSGQPAGDKFIVAFSRVTTMPSRWMLRVTMGAFGTIIDVECEPEGGKEMMLKRRLAARPNRQQLRDDALRLLKRQPNVSDAAEIVLGTEARRGLLLDVSFLCEQRRLDEAMEALVSVTGPWVVTVLPRASESLPEFFSVYGIAVRKLTSVLADLRLIRSDMLSEADLSIVEWAHKEVVGWKQYLQSQPSGDASSLDQGCTDEALRALEAVLAMRAPPTFSLDSLLTEASRASLSS